MKIPINWQLLLILILAAALRLWGINFGLPYFFHFDESTDIYGAFFAGSHQLQPHFFYFPMLYPYILLFIYGLLFVVGFGLGAWSSFDRFFIAYLTDPSIFLLLGRLLTTIFSLTTVLLVFWIGKKLYSPRIGILAAFFLSVSFLHVQESHYIKQDVLTGLFSLLIYYFSVRIAKQASTTTYLFCGLILGLFASLKYNFFIVLPTVLLAQLLQANGHLKKFVDQKILLTALTCSAIFIVLNPYLFIKWPQAWSDILQQSKLTTTQWVSSDGQPVWVYYLTFHLKHGLGMPLLLTSLFGCLYLALKYRVKKNLLLISTPAAFFLTLILVGGTNFARYAIMVLPHLSLISAIFLSWLISSNRLIIIIAILVILPTLVTTIKFDYLMTQPDTRAISKNWIEQNIPIGTKMVLEGAVRSEYLSIYGPPLSLDVKSARKLLLEVKQSGQAGQYLQALTEANQSKKGYDLLGTIRLDYLTNPITQQAIFQPDVSTYVRNNYCYLIQTSWAKSNHQTYTPEFSTSLDEYYSLIKEFKPNPVQAEDPVWRVDFASISQVNIGSAYISGPIIRIYKIRHNQYCN